MKDRLFIVGSAIKIEAVLSVDTAICSVTIKDWGGGIKITDAPMSKIADRIYQYIYQSSTNDLEGTYTAYVKIVTSSGTSYEKIVFELEDQIP